MSKYVQGLVEEHGGQEGLATALGLDRMHVTRAVSGARLTDALLTALNVKFNPSSGRYEQSAPPTLHRHDIDALRAEIRRLHAIIGSLNQTIRGLRAALTVATRDAEAQRRERPV